MKGISLSGVSFLLFFFMLTGIGKNGERIIIPKIVLELENPEHIMAVSLPDEGLLVLPNNPLGFTDSNRSDKEKKFKFTYFPKSGNHSTFNNKDLHTYGQKTKPFFQTLRFILFRNLRL